MSKNKAKRQRRRNRRAAAKILEALIWLVYPWKVSTRVSTTRPDTRV